MGREVADRGDSRPLTGGPVPGDAGRPLAAGRAAAAPSVFSSPPWGSSIRLPGRCCPMMSAPINFTGGAPVYVGWIGRLTVVAVGVAGDAGSVGVGLDVELGRVGEVQRQADDRNAVEPLSAMSFFRRRCCPHP